MATLALSGGGTGSVLIEALGSVPIPWQAITVWQVDERLAADGDPGRNAVQLAGLPCRVRLMPVTALDRPAAAARYAASLPERLDVVHLGLGSDGHTASWPPGDDDVLRTRRPVAWVAAFNGWERMTLTPIVVNAARSRLVLATGIGKRPVVERWLAGDASIPISAVHRTATTAFLDRHAAPASVGSRR